MIQNSLASSIEIFPIILEVAGMVPEYCIVRETKVRNCNQGRHIQKQSDRIKVGTSFDPEIRNQINQGMIKMGHTQILLLTEVEAILKLHKIWMVHYNLSKYLKSLFLRFLQNRHIVTILRFQELLLPHRQILVSKLVSLEEAE